MGKISVYQRDKFASSVVGAPQEDVSLAPVADALQKPIQAKVDTELAERYALAKKQQDQYIAQMANSALVQFTFADKQREIETQKLASQDPTKYPEMRNTEMTTAVEAYAKTIPDDRVRTEFMQAAQTYQKQAVTASFNWVESKQKENAAIAYDNSVKAIAQSGSYLTDVTSLGQSVLALHSTVFDSGDLISSDKKIKDFDSNLKDLTTNFLDHQLDVDPWGFGKWIDSSAPNKFSIVVADEGGTKTIKLPITEAMKKEYYDKAKKAVAVNDTKQAQDRLFKSATRLSGLIVEQAENKVGLTELLATQKALNADPKATVEEKGLIADLVKVQLSEKVLKAVDDNPTIDDLNLKWLALEKTFNSDQEATDKSVPKLLAYYSEVEKARGDGKISPATYNLMRRNIANAGLLESVSKFQPKTKGFFGFGAKFKDQKYGPSLAVLMNQVDGMPLTAEQKIQGRVLAFKNFMALNVDAEEAGVTVSPEIQQKNMAKALRATQFYFNPTMVDVKLGDVRDTARGPRKCIGYNSFGDALYESTPEEDIQANNMGRSF